MRKRSKKMTKLYVQRRAVVERLLVERPWCERCAGMSIKFYHANGGDLLDRDFRSWHQATRKKSTVIHEKKLRSAGGDILDEENLVALCAQCHLEIHAAPAKAREEGWLKGRFG